MCLIYDVKAATLVTIDYTSNSCDDHVSYLSSVFHE